jgi:hypothetical protein
LRSIAPKAASNRMPTTIEPAVAGFPQPQALDSCSPRTTRPIPATSSTAPRMSTRAGCLTSASLMNTNSVSDSSATGTLIQKMARQVQYCVRKDPAIGPTAVNRPATMKNTPRPLAALLGRERVEHQDRG